MSGYLKRSIRKLKEDALSKILYEIAISLISAIILFASTYFIPDGTKFTDVITYKVQLTVYQIVLIALSIIVVTIVIVYVIFRRRYRKLQTDYFTDELTGLKNHNALKYYLNQKIEEANKSDIPLSVILMDIDDFKTVNDQEGYNIADQLLKKIGSLLGNDKRITDETFRYFARGDEFFIVLNETSLNGAMLASDRKRELISKANLEIDGKIFNLTVCCGVTQFNKKDDDYKSLTERADLALKKAKNQANKNNSQSLI